MTTYNPLRVNIFVTRLDTGASRRLRDFVDGDFIIAEFNTDRNTAVVGSKGEVSYSEMADNMGKITCKLKHTSPDLEFIRGIVKDNPDIRVAITDGSPQGSLNAGGEGKMMNRVNRTFGKEVGEREVIFHISNLTVNE